MFENLIEQSKQPKKTPTKNQVLILFLIQGFLLVFSFLVIVFFPEKAHSVATFLLGSMAISAMLYIEIFESKNGIGMSEESASELPK